jgi:hypothetical protein
LTKIFTRCRDRPKYPTVKPKTEKKIKAGSLSGVENASQTHGRVRLIKNVRVDSRETGEIERQCSTTEVAFNRVGAAVVTDPRSEANAMAAIIRNIAAPARSTGIVSVSKMPAIARRSGSVRARAKLAKLRAAALKDGPMLYISLFFALFVG